MKKIIAMLLCVALVAAMGVSAFAGTPGKPDSKTETFSVEEWKEYLDTPVEFANDLLLYAAALNNAKAAYANELKAYNGLKVIIANAVKAAHYAAVAAYIDAAEQIAEAAAINAINEALAGFALDLEDLYVDDPTIWASVGDNPTNPIFGLGE